MRPVVSYDDIATPENKAPEQLGPPLPSANQPPAKRRKMHQKAPQRRAQHVQHWDDPGSSAHVMSYAEETAYAVDSSAVQDDEYAVDEEEEESRELTHEEVWDDSALIDAWNSANAEYEAFHGKGKNWKKEPVKKSPLSWYNVPPSPGKKRKAESSETTVSTNGQIVAAEEEVAENSVPLNFDSYVPTHDPSLASAIPPHPPTVPGPDYAQYYLPNPPGPVVTQDEGFSRALSAMYWGGYWTAVYHCQRSMQAHTVHGDVEENGEAENGDEDDLVSTQR
ncbi:hypothetical protein NM688_g4206 [Phlebia brevispora]|uniref:Uncharacterized protein n=1 Tax=Phlebia brevispora TaxID=194682 RepID=A0ACC1T3I3_9APHY|nr:hypothetical protein NM688_g4206 [Phlebia brevispora]